MTDFTEKKLKQNKIPTKNSSTRVGRLVGKIFSTLNVEADCEYCFRSWFSAKTDQRTLECKVVVRDGQC